MIADLPHCPAPTEVIQIAAEEETLAEDVLAFVLEPFQPLREQVTAITGFGLEADDEIPNESLRRLRIRSGDGSDLSVLAVGEPGGQRVIFVHGSPGLGEEWSRFLGVAPEGHLYLAPDRPGFGDSGDQPVIDLQAQADALVPLLGSALLPPVILVGYSYGGPVTLRLAADHPERVAGLLLIGAAADPGLEEIHPLQEVAALDFFEQMLPTELANSNAELLALGSGLELLEPDLKNLHVPTTIIQGTEDHLVPVGNADYLRMHLPAEPGPATVLIEGADHFLPWTHHDLLADALACLMPKPTGQASGSSLAGK